MNYGPNHQGNGIQLQLSEAEALDMIANLSQAVKNVGKLPDRSHGFVEAAIQESEGRFFPSVIHFSVSREP